MSELTGEPRAEGAAAGARGRLPARQRACLAGDARPVGARRRRGWEGRRLGRPCPRRTSFAGIRRASRRMMTMTVVAEQTFAPPRPGAWFLDPTHFTGPRLASTQSCSCRRSSAASARASGVTDSCSSTSTGPSSTAFPITAPGRSAPRRRRSVIRQGRCGTSSRERTRRSSRRLETSATVFERKPWREDLERCDREVKPAAIREHLELLAVEPRALRTEELLAYLDRCRENQKRGCYIHHLYQHARARADRGLPRARARVDGAVAGASCSGLLQGANPDPLGADGELERLLERSASRSRGGGHPRLGGEPAERCSQRCARPGETGGAAGRLRRSGRATARERRGHRRAVRDRAPRAAS